MENNIIKDDKDLEMSTRALSILEESVDKKETPIQMLEKGIVEYTQQALQLSAEMEKNFKKGMQDTLLSEFSEMNHTDQITLYNVECQQSNDRLAKLIQPTFGVINNRQTAEIQAANMKNKENGNINIQVANGVGTRQDDMIAEKVDPKIKNALYTWYQLTQAASEIMSKKEKETEETSED